MNLSIFYMHYLIHSFQLSQEVEFLQFKQQIEDNCQRRQWHPTPVLLPGKSHGRRSLVGCSPWGHWELDTTQWLHFHSSLSCVGEGNGNPLQCSCLENPRDRGAWWAAVYGVAQSGTQLKRLSSRLGEGLIFNAYTVFGQFLAHSKPSVSFYYYYPPHHYY